MPTLETVTVSPQMRDFDELCASDELSLTALQEKVNLLDEIEIHNIMYLGSCLHKACMNSKVTLEIIEYLLNIFPEAVSNGKATDFSSDSEGKDIEAYFLHCACYNKHCPSSVIRLLLERYSLALQHLSKLNNGVLGWNVRDYLFITTWHESLILISRL